MHVEVNLEKVTRFLYPSFKKICKWREACCWIYPLVEHLYYLAIWIAPRAGSLDNRCIRFGHSCFINLVEFRLSFDILLEQR